MKLPRVDTRGHQVLIELMKGSATVHQGIERHGDMGWCLTRIRQVYNDLVLNGCLVGTGVVYAVTDLARARMDTAARPPAVEARPAPLPTPPAYRGDWRTSTFSAASAQRLGARYGR